MRRERPVVLDDDARAYRRDRVVADVRLVQWMGDVTTRGVEVGEVHHRDEVEVAVEVAGIVAPRQGEQLRNRAEPVERVAICLLRFR